jgi:glucose/mannose-6-phosphate isomerase
LRLFIVTNDSRVLDDEGAYQRLDRDDMYRRVTDLPHQIEEAWRLGRDLRLPEPFRSSTSLVVAGMGGSAIGGSLLESYAGQSLPLPLTVWRGYGVPGWVNEQTLVIAISYSGNTEETVSALEEARKRGARLLAITSGGKIGALASQWGIPVLTFEYPAQPRAALGYLFTPLLQICSQLGFLKVDEARVRGAIEAVRHVSSRWDRAIPGPDNQAKRLAIQARGKAVVIYGGSYLAAVAHRWKTQMNENAKNWAFFEEFSELNHNAVVGFELSGVQKLPIEIFMLSGSHLPDRIALRTRVTADLMRKYQVGFETVEARGEDPLEEILTHVALGDYVSYYLAILNDVDPSTIEPIDFLKASLAKGGP